MLDHGALDHANISEAHAHRHAMRHSAAHVMADAVLKLFPEAKMGIGPPTQDGFYYDFDVSRPFTPEDLERIESLMREAMSGRFPFEREELSRQQAEDLFSDQPYKLELIEGWAIRRSYPSTGTTASLICARARTWATLPRFRR